LFPKAHNEHVVAPLAQVYWNKVALITMKAAPTVDDAYLGQDFQPNRQVRYWSLCVGDLSGTGTTDCLLDDQITFRQSSHAMTIVIASNSVK